MSSIFRKNKVEEKTVINNIIQKKTINQIDYQTTRFKISQTGDLQIFSVPLPINSVLKSVNVERLEDVGNEGYFQVELRLADNSENSNLRINHLLDRGSVGGSQEYYKKTLSHIYDFPIQKEGIEIQVNVYNQTGSGGRIDIHWQIENLEGGI